MEVLSLDGLIVDLKQVPPVGRAELIRFAIIHKTEETHLGYVIAYGVGDIANGNCYIALGLNPDVEHTETWATLEALGLFLEFMFGELQFRMVYVEAKSQESSWLRRRSIQKLLSNHRVKVNHFADQQDLEEWTLWGWARFESSIRERWLSKGKKISWTTREVDA